MYKEIDKIREFFDNDKTNPVVSRALLDVMGNNKPIPGSLFINIEQNKISAQFRNNLIDLLKFKLLHTPDEAETSRLLNQMQFVLTLAPVN